MTTSTTQTQMEKEMFNINQIVKGKVGHFIVLGYRTIAGEQMVQVKPYNMATGEADRGEMAMPEDCLTAA